MKARGAFLWFAALCLASPGVARKPPMRSYASPSSIFAAEIALNRLARGKGQWTALRETAAGDAVIFVPQKVMAKDWLKGRADPPAPIQWQAGSVYISCDRRTAAATGVWQGPDGEQGRFTRIWRLDGKGDWKWMLDHRERLAAMPEQPDFLEGHAAQCRTEERGRNADGGTLPDDSLRWSFETREDGGDDIRIMLWTGSAYETVIGGSF